MNAVNSGLHFDRLHRDVYLISLVELEFSKHKNICL